MAGPREIWERIVCADYSEQVAALHRADLSNKSDLAFRHVLVVAGGVSLWIATGYIFMLLWGIGYVGLNLVYLWALGRCVSPVRLGRYASVFALNIVVSLWITGMVLNVSLWGGPVSVFIAACGVCGLALHALSNHDRWSHLAYWDLFNVALASTGMVVIVAWESVSWSETVAIGLVGFGIVAYFLHSVVEIIETRTRLRARHDAEAQAEKMQAIGQLSAGIAHDFNNILTVIRGNLDLVDLAEDPAEREQFMNEAREGSDRAAHLVRQLLAFSRKSTLSVSVFSVPELLRDCAEVMNRVMPENVRVRLAPEMAQVHLEVDRSLLSTAILNAALNARDAMLPKGGTIRLSGDVVGGSVAVRIEDTGPGLPPHLFEKALEPFFTTKASGAGSGLGLSMIKGFAEQSGGRLELANRPSGGLTVSIFLPRFHDETPSPDTNSPPRKQTEVEERTPQVAQVSATR